jgi:putative transposase
MKKPPDPHHRHRFPADLISHAVWLYHVFSLSFRDVELLLAERGVIVSYESVRRWCLKFGSAFADNLRRRRPRPGDKWHLDEVFIRVQGELRYLWRAVDQNGVVLDILVQSRRDGAAAKRFLKRLLKGLHYTPSVLITDKLKSYGVAKREVLPDVEHRESRYLNNRAELAPADPAARAANAAIQVDAPGPALPIRSCFHLWALPPAAPSHDCQPVSCHA